jgi:hypothetical protein
MDSIRTKLAQSPPYVSETIPMSQIEAIARGVQARFEENTGYMKKITDETIKIARSLGVPNKEIERWADYRRNILAYETAQLKIIKNLVAKMRLTKMLSTDKSIRS